MGQDAGQENFYFPSFASTPSARNALLLAVLYKHNCAEKKKKNTFLSQLIYFVNSDFCV